METHYTVARKVRHCKNCPAKCEVGPPIVGCESIMIPTPPLELDGKMYVAECTKRIWFDKNYFPVDYWRSPTQEELASLKEAQRKDQWRKEWNKTLQDELKKLQRKFKHGKCT